MSTSGGSMSDSNVIPIISASFNESRLTWTMIDLNDLSTGEIARSMLGEVAARQYKVVLALDSTTTG
jgi:hypothetical protein